MTGPLDVLAVAAGVVLLSAYVWGWFPRRRRRR